MSTITFYLFAASPPCRSVLMTAKALGVSLELKYMDFMKGDHMQEDFMKVNPLHKAPTIIDGDFMLWESRAIMRYLVSKFGGEDNSLYPRDLQKRAYIDCLLDHDLGVFYRSMSDDLMLLVRYGKDPTEEQKERLEKAFDWLDKQVEDRTFVAGEELTIADFAFAVSFSASVLYKGDIAKYKNALAWFNRMKELPYFDEVNKPFYEVVEMVTKGQK